MIDFTDGQCQSIFKYWLVLEDFRLKFLKKSKKPKKTCNQWITEYEEKRKI